MSRADVDTYAKIIWDYHQLHMVPKKCDAIFVLCSIDTRVAERAVELFLHGGFGDSIIFSGGVTHTDDLLKTHWRGSEAEYFARIAVRMGVPRHKILIENKAQNTGENITFAYELLTKRGLRPASLLLVQKPYMERRTYAAFKKQWPDPSTEIIVTSPQIPYEAYWNEANPKELVLHLMVGDLQRIKAYPALGYQIEQFIPDQVWAAYQQLVKWGYVEHLMR